ncbi:helix-turn-helix transcriptional regulator [Streptomyces sp. MC1]|uniref:helix-turn-helix transcriptional regulator n=1 Tax=Streptomyces sp. MC1 TaxID=295105 RepID=UPI0027DB98EC|nr:helix-turn-helix transcriptional regulator [Streptomyces sp. MC1]
MGYDGILAVVAARHLLRDDLTPASDDHLGRESGGDARRGMAGPLLLFQDLQGVVDEAVLGYRPSSGPAKTHPLSPQEWEIARLAASGLTDKQTAERMFLSHRTEGARLY